MDTKTLPPNAKVQHVDPLFDRGALETPVANDEIRVVVLGGVGSGKTSVMLVILEALARAMPGTDVVFTNDEMQPQAIEGYASVNEKRLEAISQKRIEKVTLHQVQTSKAGWVKGLRKES